MEENVDRVKEASVWVYGLAFGVAVVCSTFAPAPIANTLLIAVSTAAVFSIPHLDKVLGTIEKGIRLVTGIKDPSEITGKTEIIDKTDSEIDDSNVQESPEFIQEETMKLSEIFGENDQHKIDFLNEISEVQTVDSIMKSSKTKKI